MSDRFIRRRVQLALPVVLAAACLALPGSAAADPEVTVRVEGENSTLLAETQVEIGDGTSNATTWNNVGSLPETCADDTAYQAIEKAVEGDWDRELAPVEILDETHTWVPNEEYFIFYYNDNYADRGICGQHLEDGDTVLMQAGVSGPYPTYIPESVPLELEVLDPPSGIVEIDGDLTVHVTAWQPSDIFGTQDPMDPSHWIIDPSDPVDAVGYTVTAGAETAVTDGDGEAVLTMEEAGPISVQASKPLDPENWSRTVPVEVCVDDGISCP
jgi:hypothetical protein